MYNENHTIRYVSLSITNGIFCEKSYCTSSRTSACKIPVECKLYQCVFFSKVTTVSLFIKKKRLYVIQAWNIPRDFHMCTYLHHIYISLISSIYACISLDLLCTFEYITYGHFYQITIYTMYNNVISGNKPSSEMSTSL